MNNNIQEYYCSFEVCKLLKEKGLISHGAAYTLDGEFFISSNLLNQSITGKPKPEFINTVTHALAIEWIRLNLGIWIYIGCKEKEDGSGEVWYVPCGRNLPIKKDGQFIIDNIPYLPKETPQQATEAALFYVLKNLIPNIK